VQFFSPSFAPHTKIFHRLIKHAKTHKRKLTTAKGYLRALIGFNKRDVGSKAIPPARELAI